MVLTGGRSLGPLAGAMRGGRICMGGRDLMSAATTRIGAARAGITVGGAMIRGMIPPRVDRTARTCRPHHVAAPELTGSSGRSHSGPPMVYRGKLCAVIVCRHFEVPLYGSGLHVPAVFRSHFTGGRASSKSARTAIVADAIHREIVHDRTVVNVGKVRRPEIVHRPVIKEVPAPPVPACIAHAGVTETIIDAAVEAHVGAPVTCMPDKCGSTPTPVTRRPQEADGWRHHPCTGNPEVAVRGIVSPITRSPNVASARTDWLHINGQRWRSDPN